MAGQRNRIPGKYWLAGLASLVLVVAATFGIYWLLRQRSRPSGPGQNIPISVESRGSTGEAGAGAAVVEVSEGMSEDEPAVFISLSEGQPQPQQIEALPLTQGEPLPPEEIEAILGRLPELQLEPQDQADFRLAQEPIPPPRTGETIQETFPPPPEALTPETVPSGPLEVLRFSPQGEIDVAPFIVVTFNQPMAPLDTLESLSAEEVPVQIEPALPGTWRWVGTRTLNFQYDSDLIDRLPKATDYRVTIPAGTRSQTGGELAETVEWTFSTPPVGVTNSYPLEGPHSLQPLIFIAFNQRIDPAAVMELVRVEAGGRQYPVQPATDEQIADNKYVRSMVKHTGESRWVALSLPEPLPTDTVVNVTVGPGIPSAEGPRLSEAAHSFWFRTFAPLRIEQYGCEWYNEECPPLTPFFIRFNNPIDAEAYREDMLYIEPQVPGVMVDIVGSDIRIRGATSAQTTYTVVVRKDLQDIYGQTLGRDETLTFKVGPAEPAPIGPEKIFLTVDPAAPEPAFVVHVINYNQLEVQVHAVQPSDWLAFKTYLQQYQQGIAGASIPGRKVRDETMRLETPSDRLSEVSIDLSRYMDGSSGHFIVMVRPPKGLLQREEEIRWRTIHAWVQVTPIGLDAFVDPYQMVVWATSLKNGAPLEGVSIELGAGGAGMSAATGSDGLARFEQYSGSSYLVARRGADCAMLPSSPYPWDEQGWASYPHSDQLRWFVFDDRQIYRPGEEVHLKGWLRRITAGPQGDVKPLSASGGQINYTIYEAQGNQIGQGQAPIAGLGGFDFTFTIPEQVNLGNAWINLEAVNLSDGVENWQYGHSFQILEFRRPEFEVIARNETPAPFFAGEHGVAAVSAQYYAGGALPNAEVTWNVYSSPGHYSPPNWPDFTFGKWTPWWWGWRGDFAEFSGPGFGVETIETFSGVTDAAGEHYLRLDFDIPAEPEPVSVRAEATVMDVNRQAWTDATNMLVHPASLYVGLRSQRYFVQRGDPLKVDVIVTDLDGSPVADRPVEVQAVRLEWKVVAGEWTEVEVDPQTCKLGSTLEPLNCSFETVMGGSYRIRARVTDEKGRANQTTITRWVSGGELPPRRSVEQEEVTLIPDRETYQPGDVAQVLVQSPFSPAKGLLTVSRSGILYTQEFELQDGSATLEIPISEAHIPNLNVQVDLVGSAPRTDDQGNLLPDVEPRPAYASGTLVLKIPPIQRTLTLQLLPEVSELEPGGETTLNVLVTGPDGSPQPGIELAVVVVDEAILALSNYSMADPLSVFYSDRSPDFSSYYSRAYIQLIDPNKLLDSARQMIEVVKTVEVQSLAAAPREAPGAMGTATSESAEADMGMAQAEPIRLRSDFNPLAAFVPAASTGADGFASIPVKLPDNLTRYRVMVVAVDASNSFGSGETSLTARLPLMVRPSAPRFLNFGDRFELPVVLQNQTDEPLDVSVVVRASNLSLAGDGGSVAGQRVTVPARDRIEVRFPAETRLAGAARLQIAAVTGSFADAATVELPVYTPATTEAFAVYGVVDEGAVAQPVASPEGVFPQYGGLEISTSSTAMQALTDAVIYLTSYPFDCTEQIASRILALAALKDVLAAFDASQLPSPEQIQSAVTRDIEQLRRLQNDDGGFPYWSRGFDSIPFNSVHAAYALQRAEEMGFAVPAEMRQRLLEHLRNIESYIPEWYDRITRDTIRAYALYVRMQMGDRDPAKALRLVEEAGVEKLSLDAVGWLWQVLQDQPQAAARLEEIRRLVNNRVVETPGAANFTTDYHEQTYLLLSSDRRTDAILLEALMADQPQSDLIPKLVNGLMAHRKRGRWNNTQENVFILLSLERYFKTYEAQTPDFVARIWLGDAYAGEHEFSGRTTDRRETVVPMAYLTDVIPAGEAQNLILSKEGPGRLYYRLGLRYAPTDLTQEPLDMGFVVQRVYEAVDDPGDVYQDADGTWHIKAGARVRVRLTMVADNRRYHVALADPLPAGLEIVNPALAVSGSLPQDPQERRGYYGWWWRSWFEHQNLRDERAEAFTSLLWEGVYEYTYVARATTPGVFIAPPAKAEEMYSPEVFGRSSSAVVIVE